MNYLSRLTIIIPTYNRHRYVLRAMKYWSGKEPTVLVLDGSDQPINFKNQELFGDNIFYKHFPNGKDPTERLKYGINFAHTEYTMLHADDELFLPSGLIDCIKEIEKEDLICCLGRCLQINYKDNKLLAIPWTPLHASFENYSLLDEHPEERVIKHMLPYLCSTIYGVTKTDFWKNNWIFMKGITSFDAFEIAYEIISAFQGRSKVINTLSWLRSNENPAHYNTGKKTIFTHEWWLNKHKYKKERLEFVDKIVNRLIEINPDKNIYDLKALINNAMHVYSKSADLTFMMQDMINALIRSNDPKMITDAIRGQYKIGIFNQESLTGQTPTLVEMAENWRKLGIQSNPLEVEEIENCVLKFHNELLFTNFLLNYRCNSSIIS